jgi:hypothetical protein
MEPELPKTYRRATIVDLLDRVLDRGLFLRADLVISLAGIPLIGATLSVAVAGTETLMKYGILSDWDEAIRAVPPAQRESLRARHEEQLPGEEAARAFCKTNA